MTNLNSLTSQLDLSLSEQQLEQFGSYAELLEQGNQRVNLTRISADDTASLHFVDALSTIKAYDLSSVNSLIDVGTGAGIPGIPLKIAFPHLKLTLVDASARKVDFLHYVTQNLKLTECYPIHGRIEDLGHTSEHRETFDTAIARAFADLSVLAELLLPLVKVGGHVIAQKAGNIREEMSKAEDIIQTCGGEIHTTTSFTLPDTDQERTVLVFKKVQKTPADYPRTMKKIKKA